MRLGRLSLEYVPSRYWRVGVYRYRASVVAALGPVQARWWRR